MTDHFAVGFPGAKPRTIIPVPIMEAPAFPLLAGEVLVPCGKDVSGIISADGTSLVPQDTPLPILIIQAQGAIAREFANRIATGLPWAGEAVALDDGSRANLTAMAVTASMVIAGSAGWPDNYARGWIAVSGNRIPLTEPATGLALAMAAGVYYSALVQHEQDLADAAAGAVTASALAAIDPTAGWPAAPSS